MESLSKCALPSKLSLGCESLPMERQSLKGTLPEGSNRTWVADKTLIVRAGNAGGVLVEFNNESAKQMGAPYEVQEVTFAANPNS
jgi:hypothetical protein